LFSRIFVKRLVWFTTFLLLQCSPAWSVTRGEIYDTLDLPAVPSDRATQARLFGVTRAGDRLVALGQRGFILYSDDWGDSWQQASVPVRSTLLSAYFVNAQTGWASGHDGVVLHSGDGGETWTKQLDGYEAVDIGIRHYQSLLADDPGNETNRTMLDEMFFAAEQGADRPFFHIWFENERSGFVLGAYGMSMRTDDGGATWETALLNHTDFGFRHLFDYEITPGKRYVVGEMGLVWIQDQPLGSMRLASFPYDGSIYTIVSNSAGELIVAGLRGNAFRSADQGETWTAISLPTSASVVDSIRLGDGRILLATLTGQLLLSKDGGHSFEDLQTYHLFPVSAIAEGRQGEIVVVGLGGVRVLKLN
jgi:photosystem II stability/assembly factor-like uncharacterized protein